VIAPFAVALAMVGRLAPRPCYSEETKQSIFPGRRGGLLRFARMTGKKQGRRMNQPDQTTHFCFRDLPLGDKQTA